MTAAHSHPTPRIYFWTFIALMALLVATTLAAFIPYDVLPHGRWWSTAVALLIAIAKALLVILFFMHVKYSPRLIWVFAGAAFVWLGILLVLSMSDYLTRNHPPINPRGEPRYLVESRQ